MCCALCCLAYIGCLAPFYVAKQKLWPNFVASTATGEGEGRAGKAGQARVLVTSGTFASCCCCLVAAAAAAVVVDAAGSNKNKKKCLLRKGAILFLPFS